MHDPDDGRIGCSTNRHDPTVISVNAIDSAAFVRFVVPDVRSWSIGFMYHLGVGYNSSAVIGGRGPNDLLAENAVVSNGELAVDRFIQRISPSVLRSGQNELAFRTTSNGTILRLNDETVIEVPSSQLIRRSGRSQLCVGFFTEEGVPYSIQYSDLRTRFTRAGVSGRLIRSDRDTQSISCPRSPSDPAHLANSSTDSWVVLDFAMPSVEYWSFGLVYHGTGGRQSRMILAWNGSRYRVEHVYYDMGEFKDSVTKWFPADLLGTGIEEKNRFEFETTWRGSYLYLNGERVMHAPGPQVTRRPGGIGLCTGLYQGESEPYTIAFSDLWAWSD